MSLLVLVLGPVPAAAQSTADAFFHEAAQHYIDENVSEARRAVEQGLALAPSDPRLLALRQKLEEETSSGGGSSRQQGADGPSESESSTAPGAQGQPSDRPRQNEGEARSDQQAPEPSAQQDPSTSPSRSGEAPQQSSQQSQDRGPRNSEGPLSWGQAQRLLQALEAQEKTLLREVQTRSMEEQTVEKDW